MRLAGGRIGSKREMKREHQRPLAHARPAGNARVAAVLCAVLTIAILASVSGKAVASGVPICETGSQNEQEPNDRETQATGPVCSEDKSLPTSSAWIEGTLAGAPFD